ncbi:MAG: hypothetical protein QG622_3119 [Actinomycetota bacterium]|nr:hypothetical protein [Actinomycetota bacterium]
MEKRTNYRPGDGGSGTLGDVEQVSVETTNRDDAEDPVDWVPPVVDSTAPSTARIYDFLLGGKDNFQVDREAAAQLLTAIPDAADAARANRAFLAEAVGTLARAGIRQFLDLGTGIPTSPNVHEVARAVIPDAAVVYVDLDPVVIAHDQALLASEEGIHAIQHDIRDPGTLLTRSALRRSLDFARPIGLIMIAVFHFIDVRQGPVIMNRYLQALAPGSMVAMSVGCRDGVEAHVSPVVRAAYSRTATPPVGRTRAQIEELFEGLDLLEPGLEDCYRSSSARLLSGIAVKPAP